MYNTIVMKRSYIILTLTGEFREMGMNQMAADLFSASSDVTVLV